MDSLDASFEVIMHIIFESVARESSWRLGVTDTRASPIEWACSRAQHFSVSSCSAKRRWGFAGVDIHTPGRGIAAADYGKEKEGNMTEIFDTSQQERGRERESDRERERERGGRERERKGKRAREKNRELKVSR